MKRMELHKILTCIMIIIFLLAFAMPAHANDDWQQRVVPGFTDENASVIGHTINSVGNIFAIYSINDPTGEILPFPLAKIDDGHTWTELAPGAIVAANSGHGIVRYEEAVTTDSGIGLTKPVLAGVFVIVVLLFLRRKRKNNDEEK